MFRRMPTLKPSRIRTQLVLVSGPLQLSNAAQYVRGADYYPESTVFLISLSGTEEWDSQTLATAQRLGITGPIFFLHPGAKPKISARVAQLIDSFPRAFHQNSPLGLSSLGRFFAFLQALNRFGGLWRLGRVRENTLVVGNPLELLPFYRLLLGSRLRVVVVDDGLSMLEFSRQRREKRNSRGNSLAAQFVPGLNEKRLHVFSQFEDLKFRSEDQVTKNPRFFVTRPDVGVIDSVGWILGNPFVETNALSQQEYIRLIERLVQALGRADLSVEYLPHRREEAFLAKELTARLGISLADNSLAVEERVLTEKKIARVVVGFGSTALDILTNLAGKKANLWSVLVVTPKSKTGADSPEKIFSRHSAAPGINAIHEREIEKTSF